MSARSHAAANLAWHLNDKTGIPVQVSWDNPSRRPGHGAWLVAWTDGPTVATIRGHAEGLVRYCQPLSSTMLRFSRFTTRQAWAAAMLALAHRGELPRHPAIAVGAAENELTDTDTADWDHLWVHARQLIEQADQDLYQVIALIHAAVTKPVTKHHPPPPPGACAHCATPLAPTATGRPSCHCGPACRQAAHRTRHHVTKSGNETTCATCGHTFTINGAGRPPLLTRVPNPSLATREAAGTLTSTATAGMLTTQPGGP
jgi:hypothetical protein